MRRIQIWSHLIAFVAAGCLSAVDRGRLHPEPRDGAETDGGVDGDADADVDAAADPGDRVEDPGGECECGGSADCTDGDPCNGEESCRDSCFCVAGDPWEDGVGCGEDPRSICLGGTCRGSLCGDGFVDPGAGESCDPPNESDCRSDCVYLGEPCGGSSDCASGFCADGRCCDAACDDRTCQRCDVHSVLGAGRCGYVASAGEDPDDECSTAAPPEPGSCRGDSCSGTGYSCGVLLEGEQGQPACLRCSGSAEDPVALAHFSQDTEGSNLCTDICLNCYGGSCVPQRAGQDLFGQCEVLRCCDGAEACLVEDSCGGGWNNLYLDSGLCSDCTDEWCWSRGYCRMRDCPWLDLTPAGYYCQCYPRASCTS